MADKRRHLTAAALAADDADARQRVAHAAYVNRPYLSRGASDRLLKLLHDFCRMPQSRCIHSDEFHQEMDFRFWVFRCLGAIGKAQSAAVIERFIAKHDWPLEALAEAANAHWDITRTPRYVGVLQKAKQAGVAGNTEHALREIEKYLGVTSRASMKGTGKARSPRGRKATPAMPPDAKRRKRRAI